MSFNTMVATVIDALDSHERNTIDPRLLTKIVRACASVADRQALVDEQNHADGLMQPPAMQYILAHLLMPGDYVWQPDLSFSVISEVAVDGKAIVVEFEDGRFATFERLQAVRVARTAGHADIWNQHRFAMDPASVQELHATLG